MSSEVRTILALLTEITMDDSLHANPAEFYRERPHGVFRCVVRGAPMGKKKRKTPPLILRRILTDHDSGNSICPKRICFQIVRTQSFDIPVREKDFALAKMRRGGVLLRGDVGTRLTAP